MQAVRRLAQTLARYGDARRGQACSGGPRGGGFGDVKPEWDYDRGTVLVPRHATSPRSGSRGLAPQGTAEAAAGADEVKRVLTMATSLKARAMLTLAYGCGLRASEGVRLRSGAIDSEQKIIRIVQSKGQKDRHVMLPAEVLKLLRQWWKARPTAYDASVAPEQHWLFPGRSNHQPLTTRQFVRLVKEAAKATGLRKMLSLHSLRHTFATHLLERRSDIPPIQALPGHDRLPPTAPHTRLATRSIPKPQTPPPSLSSPTPRPT